MNEQYPDIFSLYSSQLMQDSLKKSIDLNEDLPSIKIPDYFEKNKMPAPGDNYFSEIRDFISPFAKKCEEKGFGGNVFTALYEAVLNAYVHGNKTDNSKSVMLGSSIENNEL